jgi:hypothetical protein
VVRLNDVDVFIMTFSDDHDPTSYGIGADAWNSEGATQVVSLSIATIVSLAPNETVTVRRLTDGSGFTVTARGYSVEYSASPESNPFQPPVFWFGDPALLQARRWSQVWEAEYSGSEIGMAFAWINETVLPGEVCWGEIRVRVSFAGGGSSPGRPTPTPARSPGSHQPGPSPLASLRATPGLTSGAGSPGSHQPTPSPLASSPQVSPLASATGSPTFTEGMFPYRYRIRRVLRMVMALAVVN